MKKVIAVLLSVFIITICNAQIQPPRQIDTLQITGVEYNYQEILRENWPCQFIYRSTTSFNIANQEFIIEDVEELLVKDIVFYVRNASDPSGETYELKWKESKDDKINICFSGYVFTCSKFEGQRLTPAGIPDIISYGELSELKDSGKAEVVMPRFLGMQSEEFGRWVNSRLKYPEKAKKAGIYGKVSLEFIIGKDGTVSDIRVVEGVDSLLDQEVVKVTSSSPRWNYASIDGRPVAVIYKFSVYFMAR